jgi:hypothetical protein
MSLVSPAYSVGVVCGMPQYFKEELFSRKLTGFLFLYCGTKGAPLGSVIKHTFTTTQNMKLLHIVSTSDNY